MDRRERIYNPEETLRALGDMVKATMWGSLPGIIDSLGPAGEMVVNVQPAVNLMVRPQVGDKYQSLQMPVLQDCPIQFPSGGGCTLTFPLAPGDEGLLVFSSKCIDGWWSLGGVQDPPLFRMHDLSDGFFIPGIKSVPKAFLYDATSVMLRSNDDTTFIKLNPTAQSIAIVAPGGVTINGVSIDTNANVSTAGEVTAKGIPLSTHKTTLVQPGSGESGPPSAT